MFSVYPFCDDWENIYTLSYYHHQIGSINYYPLFNIRTWNMKQWYALYVFLYSYANWAEPCRSLGYTTTDTSTSIAILCPPINSFRPRQNGRHFPDDTFKRIFLNENVRITIKISLKFVPKGPITNIPAMFQMSRRQAIIWTNVG